MVRQLGFALLSVLFSASTLFAAYERDSFILDASLGYALNSVDDGDDNSRFAAEVDALYVFNGGIKIGGYSSLHLFGDPSFGQIGLGLILGYDFDSGVGIGARAGYSIIEEDFEGVAYGAELTYRINDKWFVQGQYNVYNGFEDKVSKHVPEIDAESYVFAIGYYPDRDKRY
jgi:hypothetical protein